MGCINTTNITNTTKYPRKRSVVYKYSRLIFENYNYLSLKH